MGCKAEGVGASSGFCYGYYIIFHGCASIIIACSLLWNELLVVADEQDFSGCIFPLVSNRRFLFPWLGFRRCHTHYVSFYCQVARYTITLVYNMSHLAIETSGLAFASYRTRPICKTARERQRIS